MRNNPKRAYEVVNSLRKEFRPRQCNAKDDKGRLLTNIADILQRWKEYTEGLYNENTSQVNQVDKSTDSEPLPPILETEVAEAIRHLPKGKATGYDELPAELLKLESNILIKALTKLCNVIVDTGDWPNDWKKAVFVTIPKVSGTTNCEDHRTIAFISHTSKILLGTLHNRMRNVTEEQIADVQMGFRKGVGTRDQIFNLRLLIEKAKEHHRHYISHL